MFLCIESINPYQVIVVKQLILISPMKINTYDHFIENNVVSASEEGIVYDLPRNRPQEIWDKLSNYYNTKLSKENTIFIKIDEFFKSLALARIENETMLETFRLSKNSILKSYESVESKEEKVDIRNVIRLETLCILKKRLAELKHNIEKEQKTFRDIKMINNEIVIVGNRLKILTSPFTFVDFKDYQAKMQTETGDGLTCTLKFKDTTIRGFYGSAMRKSVVNFSQYAGVFTRDNVQITLSNESCSDKNEICSLIVEEVLRNHKYDEIADHIHLLLSRYYSKKIVESSKKVEYIETGRIKLIDGMTPVFYIICDVGVVKVKRTDDDFEIHLNGQKITRFDQFI